MATYGFGFLSFSATTTLGGTGTTSIQVPGTFGGVNPVDPSQGRYLKGALVWCDTIDADNAVTLLQIVDIDGVVPSPVRAAFPNYPVIFDLIDAGSTIMLPPDPLLIEAFDTSGLPTTRFIPSQLYIKATFHAGGLGIGDVFRVLIRWGIWQ